MVKKSILITGAKGQLGTCLRQISINYEYIYFFLGKKDLDITNKLKIEEFLRKNEIDIVINCAAYTDVYSAEFDKKVCKNLNTFSVDNIAKLCFKYEIQLIHISTDYVFDGNKKTPYSEDDIPNPINHYGYTKLAGEKNILKYKLKRSAIIRTSWLYSNSEDNFVTKILNSIKNNYEINVVDDEIGSPTCAYDLAQTIFQIIPKITNTNTEIYHFSNLGFCSRYEFAKKISELLKLDCIIRPSKKKSSQIIRPSFSALDCKKITSNFHVNINSWEISLQNFLNKNNYNKYESIQL